MKCNATMKYVIPILSLIISVIALAVALPRPNNLGFDYLGVIVAIISLATAFAVGFQIWNALSLEKRLQELNAKIEAENNANISSLEKKLTDNMDLRFRITSVLNAYQLSMTTATISLSNQLYDRAFFSYIQALNYETTIINEFHIELPVSVNSSIQYLISEQDIKITNPEEQKYIVKTIIKSGSEELIEKIGVIKSKIFSSEN